MAIGRLGDRGRDVPCRAATALKTDPAPAPTRHRTRVDGRALASHVIGKVAMLETAVVSARSLLKQLKMAVISARLLFIVEATMDCYGQCSFLAHY